MKIRRFTAGDMRSALNQVRESLGSDAIILSSRRAGDAVEVVAAVDPTDETPAESILAQHVERLAQQAPLRASQPRLNAAASPPVERAAEPIAERQSHALAAEVKHMRRMLETQLASLAWNEFSQRSPLRASVLRELAQLGVAQEHARRVAEQVPEDMEFNRAVQLALGLLASEIRTTGDSWLERGGTLALAGPAGVGKTTLIAKLAARWVLRHGPRGVVLVSADSTRIGAQEQIHMLGRLLGVAAHTIQDLGELPELLRSFGGARLVLIDTAGTSAKDNTLPARLAEVARAHSALETALVVAADMQAGAIEAAFARFAPMRPSVCLITKLDEANTLGGMLSTLIHTQLPVAYCSDGPRVPEDLRPARAHQLVLQAQKLARKSGASIDEDLLQRRFGALRHVGA
jgi:flagellar biosynthesis protein FlhF